MTQPQPQPAAEQRNRPLTVPELIEHHRRTRPDADALVIDGQRLSYRELAEAVDRAAGYLHQELGLRRGEHLALLADNSVRSAVWLLAGARLGCAVVPLNTRLKGGELAYQIRHSDSAAVIVVGAGHRDGVAAAIAPEGRLSDEFPRLRYALVDGADAPAWATGHDPAKRCAPPTEAPAPDDVLIIQYTSGTTAFPKGVLLGHQQILINARGVKQRLELSDVDKVCSPSPLHHVAGTTLLLFLGLVAGAPVYTFGRFDPGLVLDTIEQEQVTVYNGIETFFIGLLKHPRFSTQRLRSIRTGWIAASAELVAQVHEEMGLTGIVNVYGISEASPNVTIASPHDPLATRRTCGRPHSEMEVRIVDVDARTPLEAGSSGIIETRGPCVTRGYYNDPQRTAESINADGWLHTGDRGHLDPGGNLVYEGRLKDMLRVGGENVAPAEIEAALLAHADVAEAAVVGVAHPRLVEVPAAFVAAHPGATLATDDVLAFVESRLASFKVPRQIEVLSRLPMTGSGKVQKYRLAELAAETAQDRVP